MLIKIIRALTKKVAKTMDRMGVLMANRLTVMNCADPA